MIDYIEENKWDEAKTIWVLHFLQLKPNNKKCFDLFGDVHMFFGKILGHQQIYNENIDCELCKLSYSLQSDTFFFHFDEVNENIQYSFAVRYCNLCSNKILSKNNGTFLSIPAWLYFDVNYDLDSNFKLHINHVPRIISINGDSYKFLCAIINNTVNKINHFRGIFLLDEKYCFVDDLSHNKNNLEIPKKHKITSLIYYLV
jgi:hypothetical protein